ncbi:acyl transferase/acyl hydrolase/lysophospholipase, partial [Flagelloscypha sp. PMI_526]
DGGGQLSFLQLVILREILYRLQEKLGLSVMPLVCEHFDVIGGSGSGGIVALLLGRFQLSINDAIPCFLDLYKGLYNDSLDKKARSALLAEGLKALVYKHLSPVDPDIRLQEDSPSCKTFVCTMPSVTITGSKPVRLFRNFRARELPSFDCAIWAAAQATTAHPKFFEPIKIGPAWAQEEFLDPGLGYNNPIEVVIEETRSIHSSTENDQCFLSLGTGHPGPSVGSVGGDGWAVLLQDIAMDCERIADRVERISSLRHLRLNVTQGLQSISFGEWIDPARLMSHTTQYLQGVDVSSRI